MLEPGAGPRGPALSITCAVTIMFYRHSLSFCAGLLGLFVVYQVYDSAETETFVSGIGLNTICELDAVQIAALGKLFAKIENAGPNLQVLRPCAKVDDLGHGTLCGNKPKRQPAAKGQITS